MNGRPTFAEIDLKALEFNYSALRKKVSKGVKFLAVVKADAYGHGAIPVSLKLERLGVDYLGVAISEEGIELRKQGIKTPILILGGVYHNEDIERLLKFNLTPVVFREESLRYISNLAKRRKRRIKVHLKVDTGMNRLGVPFDYWSEFLSILKKYPEVEVEGIMSHFSMVDEDDFTHKQWMKFEKALEMARQKGIHYEYFHMANSSTILSFPEYCGNFVRPGIMLYGAYPSASLMGLIKLKPVMTLKSSIHHLKWISAGERISYGGTFITKRRSHIATIPIGYGDGYSRFLSNKGEVLIHGRKAPIVGLVCMDFFMVDVTDIPDVKIGDEVILIGKQKGKRITVEEVAQKIGSIPYEVLCSIGKRVPRKYLDK